MNADDDRILDYTVALRPGVVVRAFPGETVVLHLGHGQFHGLNETAAELLSGVLEAEVAHDVVEGTAARHGVDADIVRTDLAQLLRQLHDRDLVALVPP